MRTEEALRLEAWRFCQISFCLTYNDAQAHEFTSGKPFVLNEAVFRHYLQVAVLDAKKTSSDGFDRSGPSPPPKRAAAYSYGGLIFLISPVLIRGLGW